MYSLPNTSIKWERPKRKHQYEDCGYQPTAVIRMGQFVHLTVTAGGRPTAAPATAGQKCYPCIDGVTAAELAAGKWVTVRLAGEAPIETSDAAALGGGQEVMSDANGRAVALVTGAGNYCGGFLQAASSGALGHRVALEVESYFT